MYEKDSLGVGKSEEEVFLYYVGFEMQNFYKQYLNT